MSTTYPLWSLSNYPDALDKTNPTVRQDIVNFEDRTSSTAPTDYYVLADDIKALQHIVLSIEEVLGVNPQSSSGTVSTRIENLEDYTDLDARYGGAGWTDILPASRPTILGHKHDGSVTGASKINLSTDVTGKVAKANVNLDRTAGGITGEDISLSSSTSQTITSKFNDKLDKTGGTIQGAGAQLVVDGPFSSRIYKEADAHLCVPAAEVTGTNVADTATFSGIARKALSTSATGKLIHYTSKLRYGDYSLGIRAKVSNRTPMQAIGRVLIYSGSTLVNTFDIIPNMFASTNYQMIYLAFSHSGSWDVNVYIEWYGTSVVPAIQSDLSVDSLVITPLHLTAYDLELV